MEYNTDDEGTEIEFEYWTQKDGTPIAVEDMSDQHIRNTINLLIRNYDKYDSSTKNAADEWLTVFREELKRRIL